LYQWNNIIEDLDYNEQQAFINFHITPDVYEELDYYRFNEIMTAKPKKERQVDPAEWLHSLGL